MVAAAASRGYNDVDSATSATCRREGGGGTAVVEEAVGRASENGEERREARVQRPGRVYIPRDYRQSG